jgi:phage FluMu protein Com
MPIRFRCAYCNQLLGIARRKAGQVVRCPTCAGQVVVPEGETEADGSDDPQPEPNPPLFERSDFDDLLNAPASGPAPAAAPAAAPAPPVVYQTPAAPAFDVEPVQAPVARPPGIFLSPTLATVLTVVVILALAVAFGAGLLTGRFLF